MPEYLNPNSFVVHLVGPDGSTISVRSHQRLILNEYFDRYISRGYIKRITQPAQINTKQPRQIQAQVQVTKRIARPAQANSTAKKSDINKAADQARQLRTLQAKTARKAVLNKAAQRAKSAKITHVRKLVVGRGTTIDPNITLRKNLDVQSYPISNNIGIGILSYNRVDSLRRLVDSIRNYTDLTNTTVFISDDGSTDPATSRYLDEIADAHFVIIKNSQNIGVAGNNNRLIRCLSRFEYGLLLNDDVEILQAGWDNFYPEAFRQTGMHHFQHRQTGIYGAELGEVYGKGGIDLRVVTERPQGAILAFTRHMLIKCGYFNEAFGQYGMEHVDWSMKAYEFGLQESGFYDVCGSEDYFKLHDTGSVIVDRQQKLKNAKALFANRQPAVRVGPTEQSRVPTITYVIPFRDLGREDCIVSVVNNVRAQRFPAIHIIIVEQDTQTKINIARFEPVYYYLAAEHDNLLFNKAKAFNLGVSKAMSDRVILHDADMLVTGNYTATVNAILNEYDACHLGATVIYASPEATNTINATKSVTVGAHCDHGVGYFEGGSLACKTDTYWRVGGFNENFWGYGCFVAGNLIATQRGFVPIEYVNNSDRLLTHTGNYQKQTARVREYSGPVFDIFIPGRLPIKGVTPEHPFLALQPDGEYCWTKAQDLRISDELGQTDVFADLSPSITFDELSRIDKSNNKFDVEANQNTLSYLVGIYLSEGVIQTPHRFRTTYLFLNEAEEFLAEHIAQLVFKLNPSINVNYDYVKNSCRHVVICNSYLAKFIYAQCGKHKATTKIVAPQYLNSLTDTALGYLLGGLLDGDGGHQCNSEVRLIYHTSSYNLAFAISSVMRRLGIAHSFGKRKGGGFANSQRWSYDLCVNREFEHLINGVYPKKAFLGSNSCGRTKFGTIYDIRTRHYKGLVYNFEVEHDNSYCVQGIIAHNCEDCEFYTRLSQNSRWLENRKFDFLHMWHGRTPGWEQHHIANKILEARLSEQPMPLRILDQHKQLALLGYQEHVAQATK